MMLIVLFLSVLYISLPLYSEDDIKTITVSSPNGGEEWAAGSSQTISWTSTGDIQNVQIHYSIDNGANWLLITDSTPNISGDLEKPRGLSSLKCDKSYEWTVPDTLSDQCLVRIRDVSESPSDESDCVFKIVPAEEPEITVYNPNGGEEWNVGSTRYIQWLAKGNIQNVQIHYSIDNGANWILITDSTPNISESLKKPHGLSLIKCENSFEWVVPDTLSEQCLVRVRDVSGTPSDTSDSVFKIIEAEEPTITVFAPNGGEEWSVGSTYFIQWTSTGDIQKVQISYSIDNGINWIVITNSTPNKNEDLAKPHGLSLLKCENKYAWVVPDTISDECLVRIRDESGTISDTSDSVFKIVAAEEPTITVIAPNGGEEWAAGSNQQITWDSTGSIDNVKIEYSLDNGKNWKTIIESKPNKSSYHWLVPDTPSTECLVKVSAADGTTSDTSDATFTIISVNPPVLHVNRDKLNFAYILSGENPEAQWLVVSNQGGGTLKWNATANASWIIIAPTEGENEGAIEVKIDPTGLEAGDYTGTITVQETGNPEQTATITVDLKVKTAEEDRAPIGSFDTPVDNTTVSGSIPLTGWALDDVRIDSVSLYYEAEDMNLVYIGKATFVEGARPDIVPSYPDYPRNFNAGWGYMLLTNYLPNKGNGTFRIHAIVTDSAGHSKTLEVKTIRCDNMNAEKPFGALDTPDQGGSASGKSFVVFGWALTPSPNLIPADGSTISVWVDGVNLGHPKYNQYREDIASLFPGYANSLGAIGYYVLDTKKYRDGLHTICWIVQDSAGNTEGIGSRYFTIRNSSSDTGHPNTGSGITGCGVDAPFKNQLSPIYGNNYEPPERIAGNGEMPIEIQALDLLKLRIVEPNLEYHASLLSDLPIGSTFDAENGIFYWQPGPGFLGDHLLKFKVTDINGNTVYKDVSIHILPR
jgi:hypothetical protein